MVLDRDSAILELFARRVREQHPEARVWAFGSRARCDAEPESDLDLCVVFPGASRADTRQLRDLAWEIGFEHDLILNVFVFSTEDFERGALSESTLVANIHRDGVPA